MTATEISARIARLRKELATANGEYAEQIEGDIRAFERMLADAK